MMTMQPLSLRRACVGVGLFCFMARVYCWVVDSLNFPSRRPALWEGKKSHPSLWKAKKGPYNEEVNAHVKKGDPATWKAKKRPGNDLLNSSATSGSTVPPTEFPTESPTAVQTSGRTSSPTKKGSVNNVDACTISMAMQLNPLHVSSYFYLSTFTLPNSRMPHVSSALCSAAAKGSYTSEEWFVNMTEPTKAVFAFKAARVGSRFFTTVIQNTMRKTFRPTSMFWEPFAWKCEQSGSYQEDVLNTLLTQNCQGARGKCYPDKNCNPMSANEYGPPVFVTAANPRFFDLNTIQWRRVFRGVAEPRIFSLRRTNVMLVAYSKFHHGGCAEAKETAQLLHPGFTQEGTFTFETMLLCVEHYAIGDQEISSSVAFQAVAASGSGARPFLVVYEDVIANGPLVQQEMLRYLSLDNMNDDKDIDVFEDNASSTKVHSDPFCEYEDVDCEELREGLRKEYPCLLKQLTRAGEGLAWSVPMLPDGKISVKGDCHPLKPLTENKRVRSFEELYQLP